MISEQLLKGVLDLCQKISSFRDVKEVSDRAVITACQIASAQEIIWTFFFFSVLQNKSPHPP